MSAGLEFPATSIKQLQDEFFLRTLPFRHPAGEYYFRSSGLNSPTGTVVLFQFENHLVASATLISANKFSSPSGEYSGVLAFAPPSIRVFEPIDAQNLKAIWPSFRAFSNAKQSLDPELYPNFEKSLLRVRSPEGPVLLPGEDVPNEVYLEGGKTKVEVNAYERNWNARRACINHHGTACKICCIDFLQLYGETARGFIHVHHIEPLSKHDGPREVDPKTDLVPVCPNCHAVLHMKSPCYTVDEVKAMIHSVNQEQA
jgi:hypothetical protein